MKRCSDYYHATYLTLWSLFFEVLWGRTGGATRTDGEPMPGHVCEIIGYAVCESIGVDVCKPIENVV